VLDGGPRPSGGIDWPIRDVEARGGQRRAAAPPRKPHEKPYLFEKTRQECGKSIGQLEVVYKHKTHPQTLPTSEYTKQLLVAKEYQQWKHAAPALSPDSSHTDNLRHCLDRISMAINHTHNNPTDPRLDRFKPMP
jgi:hypothetical protein